jgi:hypothetical protein
MTTLKATFTLAFTVTLLLAIAVPAFAATWNGGSGNWNDGGNWNTPADVPDTGGEPAVIGDAGADQTIAGNATTIRHLDWTQTTDNVTQTIVMDRHFQTNIAATSVSNTGTNSNLIMDLNGFRWKLNMTATNTINNIQGLRIEDSGVGGWVESDNIGLHTDSSVGPGVLMKSGNGEVRSQGSWDPTATLTGTTIRFDINFMDGTGLGNVEMPVANQGNYLMENRTFGRVQSNFDISGPGAKFTFAPNASRQLVVGGNFTDVNTDGLNYTHSSNVADAQGILTFAGNPASPRTVDIGRSLLIDMNVGLGAPSETGNIVLARDLTTAGDFAVLGGSKLNVGVNTLTVGNLDLFSGSETEFGFGSNGQIVVGGTANLAGDLTLALSGLSTFSAEMTLVQANVLSGTFDNAPNGTIFTNSLGAFEVVYNASTVRLLGSAIVPEPSVLSLLGLCGAAALRRQRR